MTQATEFANRFGNDGQNWQDAEGFDFTAVLAEMKATAVYSAREYDDNGDIIYVEGYVSSHLSGDPIRYMFQDSSAIVESGAGWDIEGSTPFSWQCAE